MTSRILTILSALIIVGSLSSCRSSRPGGTSSKPATTSRTSEATENKGYWLVGGEDDNVSTSETESTGFQSTTSEATSVATIRIPPRTPKPKAKPVSTPKTSSSEGAPSWEKMQQEVQAFKASATPGEYSLDKGDTVIIHLQGIPDPETVEDIVDANGMITLPLIDEIQALGMSSRQIESSIKSRYVPDYYQRINITVLVPTKSYYVEGKVKDPGKFQLRGVVTVMQAIAESGGVDEFAHKWKVLVTRGDQVIMLDRRAVKEKPSLDLELEPGDRVFVDASIL